MANIVAATQKKVKSFLKQIHGKRYADIVQEVNGSFVVRRGSAAVHLTFKSWGKDDCLVTALAYIVQNAKVGPKILGHLMRRNATEQIGAYGLLFDDTIVFSHSIAGANLDMNELRITIGTVAFVADESDDDIRKIAGGLRAVDANAGLLDLPVEKPARKARSKKPSSGKSIS
jgi:hypothetical protein